MQGVTLRMLGHEATFEVLNMMEFSSERGRMSVIARSPDGTIRLFAKGADSKMLSIVNKNTDPQLLEQTARNLHLFATQVKTTDVPPVMNYLLATLAYALGSKPAWCGSLASTCVSGLLHSGRCQTDMSLFCSPSVVCLLL